jgi:predicted ATP-grasp superfamily ATP-dependent carboligase
VIDKTVKRGSGGRSRQCDILILDAAHKQSLAGIRSLGRAGLRVAAGESLAQFDPAEPIPAFRSRYCALTVVLPDLAEDAGAFAGAVLEFVREHSPRVVLPTGDATISALRPYREALAELGCALALAAEPALEVANDKDATLDVAGRLGISYPRSVKIASLADLPAAVSEFGFPFVLKPTISWTGQTATRVVPVEVVSEAEAVATIEEFLAAGSGILAQEWLPGRREGVTLFVVGGSILASCGHVAHRTSPPLGGASVVRESIATPPDVLDAAVRLVKEIGLEGVCEVEFRRDAQNRPMLMEANARLAGTIENSVQAGVDFPLMIWQWATGDPVSAPKAYRTGIRTRWLHGDLRWLLENAQRAGRPDSIPRRRSILVFGLEFIRARHYDYFDHRDLRPFLTEMRHTAKVVLGSVHKRSPAGWTGMSSQPAAEPAAPAARSGEPDQYQGAS